MTERVPHANRYLAMLQSPDSAAEGAAAEQEQSPDTPENRYLAVLSAFDEQSGEAPAADAAPQERPTAASFDDILAHVRAERAPPASEEQPGQTPAPQGQAQEGAPQERVPARSFDDILARTREEKAVSAAPPAADARPAPKTTSETASSPEAAVAAFLRDNPDATPEEKDSFAIQTLRLDPQQVVDAFRKRGVDYKPGGVTELLQGFARNAKKDGETGAGKAFKEGVAGLIQGMQRSRPIRALANLYDRVTGGKGVDVDQEPDILSDNAVRFNTIGYYLGPGAKDLDAQGKTATHADEVVAKYGPSVAVGAVIPGSTAVRGLSAVGRAAVAGGASGALTSTAQGHYAEDGETFSDAVKRDAVVGGTVGAVTGGALNATGQLVRPAIRAVANAVAGPTVKNVVAEGAEAEAGQTFRTLAAETRAAQKPSGQIALLEAEIKRLGPKAAQAKIALRDLKAAADTGSQMKAGGSAEAVARSIHADRLYENVNQMVAQAKGGVAPARSATTLAQVETELEKQGLSTRYPAAAAMIRELREGLVGTGPNGAVADMDPAAALAASSQLRSRIRALSTGINGVPDDAVAGLLKQTSKALTEDIETFMAKQAPKGTLEAFRNANNFYRENIVPYKGPVGRAFLGNQAPEDTLARLLTGSTGAGKAGGNVASRFALLDDSGQAAARTGLLDSISAKATAGGTAPFDSALARAELLRLRNAANVIFPEKQKFLLDGFIKAADNAKRLAEEATPKGEMGEVMRAARHLVLPAAAGGYGYHREGNAAGAATFAAAGFGLSQIVKAALQSQAGRNLMLDLSGIKGGTGKSAEGLTTRILQEGLKNLRDRAPSAAAAAAQADGNSEVPLDADQVYDLPTNPSSEDDGNYDLPGMY